MNLPGVLLLTGLLCWSLALLRVAISLLDVSSATRCDLLRAGLSAASYLPLWCWLRVGLSLGAGMVGLWSMQRFWPHYQWSWLFGCFAGLWLGWRLPAAVLNWQAQRRERRLGLGATQLVERLVVALLCGAEPAWALQRALTRSRDAELGSIMLRLIAQPLMEMPVAGIRARRSSSRRGQQMNSFLSDWQVVSAVAPPVVRGLARVLRRASRRSATESDVERLKLTLQSWSRSYASGAYDWQVIPPEPKVHQLEDRSAIVFNSM